MEMNSCLVLGHGYDDIMVVSNYGFLLVLVIEFLDFPPLIRPTLSCHIDFLTDYIRSLYNSSISMLACVYWKSVLT